MSCENACFELAGVEKPKKFKYGDKVLIKGASQYKNNSKGYEYKKQMIGKIGIITDINPADGFDYSVNGYKFKLDELEPTLS